MSFHSRSVANGLVDALAMEEEMKVVCRSLPFRDVMLCGDER